MVVRREGGPLGYGGRWVKMSGNILKNGTPGEGKGERNNIKGTDTDAGEIIVEVSGVFNTIT